MQKADSASQPVVPGRSSDRSEAATELLKDCHNATALGTQLPRSMTDSAGLILFSSPHHHAGGPRRTIMVRTQTRDRLDMLEANQALEEPASAVSALMDAPSKEIPGLVADEIMVVDGATVVSLEDMPSRLSCASGFSDSDSGGGVPDSSLKIESKASMMSMQGQGSTNDNVYRPGRLILIRHGESEANAKRDITENVPDHALHLTQKGREQAAAAGRRLHEVIGDESVTFIVSPYVRAKETFNGLMYDWQGQQSAVHVREDIQVREQDYGNFDRPDMKAIHKEKDIFGKFWYRFPEGESPADVYDRASIFIESLYRRWDHAREQNLVIVSHGLFILVFLMRLFRYSVEDFYTFEALKNCEFVVLEKDVRTNFYDLAYTWAGGESQKLWSDEERLANAAKKPRKDGLRTETWCGDPQAPVVENVSYRKNVKARVSNVFGSFKHKVEGEGPRPSMLQ